MQKIFPPFLEQMFLKIFRIIEPRTIDTVSTLFVVVVNPSSKVANIDQTFQSALVLTIIID